MEILYYSATVLIKSNEHNYVKAIMSLYEQFTRTPMVLDTHVFHDDGCATCRDPFAVCDCMPVITIKNLQGQVLFRLRCELDEEDTENEN